jgi:hypothetical protein
MTHIAPVDLSTRRNLFVLKGEIHTDT